jgi:hypothetical protein
MPATMRAAWARSASVTATPAAVSPGAADVVAGAVVAVVDVVDVAVDVSVGGAVGDGLEVGGEVSGVAVAGGIGLSGLTVTAVLDGAVVDAAVGELLEDDVILVVSGAPGIAPHAAISSAAAV